MVNVSVVIKNSFDTNIGRGNSLRTRCALDTTIEGPEKKLKLRKQIAISPENLGLLRRCPNFTQDQNKVFDIDQSKCWNKLNL
jgi:hypothetical protein